MLRIQAIVQSNTDRDLSQMSGAETANASAPPVVEVHLPLSAFINLPVYVHLCVLVLPYVYTAGFFFGHQLLAYGKLSSENKWTWHMVSRDISTW